jgi:hypothetical protein
MTNKFEMQNTKKNARKNIVNKQQTTAKSQNACRRRNTSTSAV